ncbi:mannose-6-phosphate isomerase, class I [Plesiomonas shigelloides]|uniref:mannose-6-phosphate isomerase, class I n=1 Tax=Plesiomonas shigelloides TaxID=703 RepID=UPI00057A3B01|nr:mannose-6-phosphate isomerase, class I [Plesiomonas shigelloides]
MWNENKKINFFIMDNVVKNYSWGSKHSLTELFGIENNSCEPQAELWMGAHENGCSSIEIDKGEKVLLSDFISDSPDEILSQRVSATFSNLPFLFKVLAADCALSIQVHPSKKEAEDGYEKEVAMGRPISAINRNYKDANHKPELVYALTPYKAMNGFREYDEIERLLTCVDSPLIETLVNKFSSNKTSSGLKELFKQVVSLAGKDLSFVIEKLLFAAGKYKDKLAFQTVLELHSQYGNDVGLFSPLMLNVINLEPGQAMFLSPRTPHAYIKGTGLEVMANSDNVLRAGLTNKHIDIEELVKCTEFSPKDFDSLILPGEVIAGEIAYSNLVDDFSLSVYFSPKEKENIVGSAEIILSLDSDVLLMHPSGESLKVKKGQSVFIPAYAKKYYLLSMGRVARVYC